MKKLEPKGKIAYTTYMSDFGGVGYIRTIMPSVILGSLRYKKMSFEPTYLMRYVSSTEWYNNQSFVKFQRSATQEQLKMIKHFRTFTAQQTNTPLIYEIDDLLFNIPKSNFASDYYEENKPYIEEMLQLVSGVTVSTPFLRDYYKLYNSNVSVVKNRLAKCLWGDIKEYEPVNEKPRIIYPGSQNHFGVKGRTEEGGDIGPDLMNFIKKTKKDYEWMFIGAIPEELKNDKDIKHIPWVHYISYPQFIKNCNADIGIAPLQINDFNRGKSNLKMLEYSASGIPGVYTDIEPYKDCRLTTENENAMIDQIQWLVENPQKRYEVWSSDTKKIRNDLFLEDNIVKYVNEHLKLFNQKIE